MIRNLKFNRYVNKNIIKRRFNNGIYMKKKNNINFYTLFNIYFRTIFISGPIIGIYKTITIEKENFEIKPFYTLFRSIFYSTYQSELVKLPYLLFSKSINFTLDVFDNIYQKYLKKVPKTILHEPNTQKK